IPAEPVSWVISLDTRKMPLPMIVPTTIAVACQTFSSRTSSGLRLFSATCIRLHQAGNIANAERGQRSHHHVPGKRNFGPTPNINSQGQPAEHTNNRAGLFGTPRQDAQQKDSQQPAMGQ